MEIKVKIDAAEVVTALIAIADVLDEINKRLAKTPTVTEVKTQVVEEVQTHFVEQEPAMTVVQLRAAINELINAGTITNGDVRSELDRYGVKKLTDLPDKHFTELLKGLSKS